MHISLQNRITQGISCETTKIPIHISIKILGAQSGQK